MNKNRTQRKINRFRRVYDKTINSGRERLNYPFAKFVALMPYMTEETIKGIVFIPVPKTFCKKPVPQDLQGVTFGTLTQLQQAPTDNDYLKTCCKLVSVLMGVPADVVASRRAVDVLGVVNMIQAEMERIGKLFKSLQVEKSSDELMAGIEQLDFGAFGLVDWYAQRMGIIDHEEVFKTPWARIFQCMKIDYERGEFEKRYRKLVTRRTSKK